MSTEPVLTVRNLSTSFRTDRGTVTAVDDVSFDLYPGESLGVVGESGCGKTVTSKSIMRLLPEEVTIFGKESRIEYQAKNLLTSSQSHMRYVCGNEIAMIFQEPMTALNPVFTVGWQLDEALKYHTKLSTAGRRERAIEMMRLVEMPNPERRLGEYPHQLSGGMRQRVMIAIALCCEPRILIADEPTTALDVTIQAQILRLMAELQTKTGTAVLLVTHDLGVVAQTCDRVMVMYAGRVVEYAPVNDIFRRPQHPYTKALLSSMPQPGKRPQNGRLPAIDGVVPSLFALPKGCRFHDRCSYCEQKCIEEEPAVTSTENRAVRCHFPIEAPDAASTEEVK